MAHRVSTSGYRIDPTSWRDWLVEIMSTCPTMTDSQLMRKFLKSSSRWRCTSSCARSLISWHPTCFITVTQCSMLVPDLITLRMLRAVACSCLKEQKERIMFGTISARGAYVSYLNRSIQFSFDNLLARLVFLLSQPVSVHDYSTSFFRLTSPLFGSANASSNRSPSLPPFLSLLHASFVLLLSLPRSKRQSGT